MDRSFLFITCQVGAEAAVKREVPHDFRFAYSRPGFLTFRLPAGHLLADDFTLRSVFARAHGFSLEKVSGDNLDVLAAQAWQFVADRQFDRLHVWQRDTVEPGFHSFQPGLSPLAHDAAAALMRLAQTLPQSPLAGSPLAHPAGDEPEKRLNPANSVATPGELVLDCVLVEPNEWWLGYHRARALTSCLPGGFWPIEQPAGAVSRAYLKMDEALQWSQLPIKPGDRCVEIGSSPGGASQALLNRGLLVTGIDPAEMDDAVLANPHFVHIRKRGHEVRRREFRKVRWLCADMNVPPQYTLDTVEAIVTNPEVRIRGLLMTLKLPDWKLAAEVPNYLKRIRAWGYPQVQARQLQHNRQEICVAALQPSARSRLKRDIVRRHIGDRGIEQRGIEQHRIGRLG